MREVFLEDGALARRAQEESLAPLLTLGPLYAEPVLLADLVARTARVATCSSRRVRGSIPIRAVCSIQVGNIMRCAQRKIVHRSSLSAFPSQRSCLPV